MKCENMETVLSQNSYPGRGIVIGRSEGGQHMAIA